MLSERHGLALIELKNLPVKILGDAESPYKLYQYGIEIKFRGDFFDILDYLNINLVETVLAPGVGGRGEVKDSTTVLKAAHLAGRKAIEILDR